MTSHQIRALLSPRDVHDAENKAVLFLNSKFQSLEDLNELEAAVLQAKFRHDTLKSTVRINSSFVPGPH